MLWGEGVAPSALFNKPTAHPMSQPFDASKSLATLEQDNTVIAVIEMSQSKWLVAPVVPGSNASRAQLEIQRDMTLEVD